MIWFEYEYSYIQYFEVFVVRFICCFAKGPQKKKLDVRHDVQADRQVELARRLAGAAPETRVHPYVRTQCITVSAVTACDIDKQTKRTQREEATIDVISYD